MASNPERAVHHEGHEGKLGLRPIPVDGLGRFRAQDLQFALQIPMARLVDFPLIVILFEIRTLRPYMYYYISIFFNVLQLL
jgi:hypothetical protein